MPRTRNRSIKDFVSKDKEKDDGISRVLGSGTKDLKNESSSQRTCSYTLWNISINSYIKNSFIFNFVWSLTFPRRAFLPRSRQQLFFVLQLTLPLRMPYVPIATPPTDVRKISFRVTSIAPSPAWTLTWRAGRGMTTHVSDTWAGTGRGDQSFPRRHAYFFLLPSSGTGNREKTGDKQVKHSSNKSFRGQQLKKNVHEMWSLTMCRCPRSWRSGTRQTRTPLAARPAWDGKGWSMIPMTPASNTWPSSSNNSVIQSCNSRGNSDQDSSGG